MLLLFFFTQNGTPVTGATSDNIGSSPSSSPSSSSLPIIVGATVGGVVLLLIVAIIIAFVLRRRRTHTSRDTTAQNPNKPINNMEMMAVRSSGPTTPYADIHTDTTYTQLPPQNMHGTHYSSNNNTNNNYSNFNHSNNNTMDKQGPDSAWLIDYSEVTILSKLGQGSFGVT